MYLYIHMYKMVLDQLLAVCKVKLEPSLISVTRINSQVYQTLNVKYEPIQMPLKKKP